MQPAGQALLHCCGLGCQSGPSAQRALGRRGRRGVVSAGWVTGQACRIIKAVMCEMEEEDLHALLMLSVLPGSFTLEAAEEALGLSSAHPATLCARTQIPHSRLCSLHTSTHVCACAAKPEKGQADLSLQSSSCPPMHQALEGASSLLVNCEDAHIQQPHLPAHVSRDQSHPCCSPGIARSSAGLPRLQCRAHAAELPCPALCRHALRGAQPLARAGGDPPGLPGSRPALAPAQRSARGRAAAVWRAGAHTRHCQASRSLGGPPTPRMHGGCSARAGSGTTWAAPPRATCALAPTCPPPWLLSQAQ